MKTLLLAALVAVSATAAENPPPKTVGKTRGPRLDPEYQRRTFKGAGDAELNYGWLVPIKAETGKQCPLVICLHGAGGSTRAGSVLARQALREKYPAFVMVPQAEGTSVWALTDAREPKGPPMERSEKLPVLIEAVRSLLKTDAVDPARVYITGQSRGGVGTWGAIARHPDLFAAAVPVCGAWGVEDTAKMTRIPVWAFHGEKDPTVAVHFSRDLTQALTKAGGTVKYTEYPGVGHDSWMKAYEEPELWPWLFAQRKTATK